MTDLAGSVAVVPGASSGIGRATARTLAAAGAAVVLAARRRDRLESLATEIEDAGGQALVVPTDVADRDQIERLVERTTDAHGGVDVLVNNAGIGDWDNLGVVEADLEAWEREIAVNLLSVMRLTRLFAPVVRPGSHVINVSSGVDRAFSGEHPSYVTSKWGVRGFTGSTALALREHGLRATLLSPGEVDTPIQPEGAAEDSLAENVRLLDPDDVAEAVLYVVTRPPHVSISTLRIAPSRIDPDLTEQSTRGGRLAEIRGRFAARDSRARLDPVTRRDSRERSEREVGEATD